MILGSPGGLSSAPPLWFSAVRKNREVRGGFDAANILDDELDLRCVKLLNLLVELLGQELLIAASQLFPEKLDDGVGEESQTVSVAILVEYFKVFVPDFCRVSTH